MAHRLSRTARGRAIRNVRVGRHGTMNMATLRPFSKSSLVAPKRRPVRFRNILDLADYQGPVCHDSRGNVMKCP